MTTSTIDQFLSELEQALVRELDVDACEIRLYDQVGGEESDLHQAKHCIQIPLKAGSRTIGHVVPSRELEFLSDRARITLPVKLSIAAERIELMRQNRWPYVPEKGTADPTERARMERDEFASLLRAQEMVARQEETDATLTAIVIELERILNPVNAHIYTIDHYSQTLINRVSRIAGHQFPQTFSEIPIGTGLLGSVVRSGEAVLVPLAHEDPRSFYPPDVEPLIRLLGESVMVAPLRSGGEINGAIFVNRLGHRHFTDHEFGLFQLFAGNVEAAFDNALRLDSERESRRAAELLSGLATNLAAIDSESAFLRAVTESVRDLTGAEFVSVAIKDRTRNHAVVASLVGDGNVRIIRRERSLESVHSTSSHSERLSESNGHDSGSAIATADLNQDLSNAIATPITGTEETLGEIFAASPGKRLPSSMSEFLESVASIAAVTLERIRVRDLASELEGTIDVLMRSSRIALDAQVDEDAVSDLIALLGDIVDARFISAWLTDPHIPPGTDSALNLVAFHGPAVFETVYAETELSTHLDSQFDIWDSGALIVADTSMENLHPNMKTQCDRLGIGAIVAFKLADLERQYGLLRIDFSSESELPPERVLRLVKGVVEQFSLGLGAVRMRERWMDLYRSSVKALAATVDAKDPYTHTHSRNVAFYSRLLAERLGLTEDQIQHIELAGLLHDIGKISIADRILSKTGPLDPHERMEMMAHPVRGAQILAGDEGLTALVPIIRHHHERHDGLGYPDGLSGDDIPLGATIVGVADAVDTMLNERSYARRRTIDEVRSEVRAASGTQFSPQVASALIALIDEEPGLIQVGEEDGFDAEQIAAARDHLPIAEVAQIRVISRVAQELSALTDLGTFVRGACSIVAEELGYDQVEICLDPLRPDSMSLGFEDEFVCGRHSRMLSRFVIEGDCVVNIPELSLLSEPNCEGDTGSALSVPLRVEGDLIGAICVVSERPSYFTIVDEAMLTVAANQLAAGLRVAQLHDQVKWIARHDALTQALDHGAFYEELANAIATYQRTAEPVSLILCDVEGLKSVNDQLGHLAGDEVLRKLVRRIREIVRSQDLIARYGGDEFAIITFGTTSRDAAEITRRLHETLRVNPLLGDGSLTQVTTGVAQVGEDGLTPAELVRIADHRLYQTRGRR